MIGERTLIADWQRRWDGHRVVVVVFFVAVVEIVMFVGLGAVILIKVDSRWIANIQVGTDIALRTVAVVVVVVVAVVGVVGYGKSVAGFCVN